ncbi:hypothetical protein [Oceanobacillus rekensis]|uniref:hypothetical protein n=1 Tax=Oceanobacillus rekensis TaxID=937927 RepID=UPI000B43FA99|nr:hypothetical protein [Oceanobacillus rekensis]
MGSGERFREGMPRLKAFLSYRIHTFHSGADTWTLLTEARATATRFISKGVPDKKSVIRFELDRIRMHLYIWTVNKGGTAK